MSSANEQDPRETSPAQPGQPLHASVGSNTAGDTGTGSTTEPRSDGAEPDAESTSERSGARIQKPQIVVGIGASAGGLTALLAFLEHMPPDSGAGIVVLQHLDPDHESLTPEILRNHTQMRVGHAEDGAPVESDAMCVLPPGTSIRIEGEFLRLEERAADRAAPSVIDHFLRSLAEERGPHAVGILLSGGGSDGTLGLKAVKAHGGMTMVQDPDTAEFDGMPRSAIRANAVDHVLPVPDLARALARHVARRGLRRSTSPEHRDGAGEWEGALSQITAILRARTGHDFGSYRKGTLGRRLERRLQLRGDALDGYAARLRSDPAEVDALFRDLLIGVTEFFRDGEAWNALAEEIPRLFHDRADGDALRVWVPACATGEEAYSIAILLDSRAAPRAPTPEITVFATDIDESALRFAREGLYPDGIGAQVPDLQLERFFAREDHHYRVSKRIRQMCMFAPHDVLQDAPFSRIDLITCRNLLIYLEPEAQRRTLAAFAYALRPGGYLFLGSSENLPGRHEYFRTVDKEHRIFRRTEIAHAPPVDMMRDRGVTRPKPGVPRAVEPWQTGPRQEVRPTVERILLQSYGPACVLINRRHEVLHFFGRTGKYLEPSAGEDSANVLDMALPGLRATLRETIRKVERQRAEVVRANVPVEADGRTEYVELVARPAWELGRDSELFLVVIRERGQPVQEEAGEAGPEGARQPAAESDIVRELEAELVDTRQRLHAAIEELESSNEELRSSNEELLAMNEEHQTAKEEVQSINEELQTVNAELRNRMAELDRAHSDLHNLFQSTHVATIFLDKQHRIQRFTPTATELFRLREGDIGRPLADIAQRFTDGQLMREIERVLDTLVPQQMEVRAAGDERWYTLRIFPYRTIADVIDGVVLTFADVTELKRTEARVEGERRYAQSIVDTVHEPLIVLDESLRVVSASRAFLETFRVFPEEVVGAPIYRLGAGQWDIPALRELLEQVIPHDEVVEGYEVEADFAHLGRRVIRLDARAISEDGAPVRILLALADVTDARRRAHTQNVEAQRKDWFLAMLGHELRNPLASIRNSIEILERSGVGKRRREQLLAIVDRQFAHLTRLVDDLLDMSRITAGELTLRKGPVELVELVRIAADDQRGEIEGEGLTLELDLPDRPARTTGDPARITQALGNLLSNARKYTPEGGRIGVEVRGPEDGVIAICVSDTGAGMTADSRAHLFDPFFHGPRGPEHTEQGLGVGLTLVRAIMEAHGGSVEVESEGAGRGSRFTLRLPVRPYGEERRGVASGSEPEAPGKGGAPAKAGAPAKSGAPAKAGAPAKSGAPAKTPPDDDAAGEGAGEGAAAGSTPPEGASLRILIVEDNPDMVYTTRMLLENQGHEVADAADGDGALEKARELRPDVVLCDLGLPGELNGYDIARAIRADPDLGSIRLIALTGYGQAADRKRGQEAGFDAFLVKPVRSEDLQRALAE